ncbi:MAG: hypothetical protein Q9166_003804 [cf. Caloplaca sp. 2 TL-2023]
MDINAIIDSDASGSSSKTPARLAGSRNEVDKQYKHPQDVRQGPHQDRVPGYQQNREQRPPQPPPLRPPLQNEFRSPSTSSYTSTHSPYQQTPSSALSTAQHPFPQPSVHSPASSAQAINIHQYEGQSFVPNSAQQAYRQTPSLPQTPTTATSTILPLRNYAHVWSYPNTYLS